MTWQLAFTIGCPLMAAWGWYWGRRYERARRYGPETTHGPEDVR